MSLNTGIISYWKLDESSGNASDSVGSNTLTNTNTVPYVAGKLNNCADLEASSSHNFQIADASQTGLDITDDISMFAWINIESLPASGEVSIIMGKDDFGIPSRAYYLGIGNTGGTYSIRLGVNGTGYASTGFAFQLGTWYHIGVVRQKSDGAIVFYKDGVAFGTGTDANAFINSTAKFAIGTRFNSGVIDTNSNFDGKIDEVGIWSAVLSQADVTRLYNGGTGLQYDFPWILSVSDTVPATDSISTIKENPFTVSDTVSMTDSEKNTYGWVNDTKHDSTWTNQTKH